MKKTFKRKDTHKKARLPLSWRKPDGITNKKRLNRKGHSANVRPGYGLKASQRNTADGLKIILVHNLAELKKINPKAECVVLARMGKQKKLELIKEASSLKIKLFNLNVKKYEEKAKDFFESKKQLAKKKADKVQKAKLEEKKSEDNKEKEAQQPEINEEEKKKVEKAEKDKLLTKSR